MFTSFNFILSQDRPAADRAFRTVMPMAIIFCFQGRDNLFSKEGRTVICASAARQKHMSNFFQKSIDCILLLYYNDTVTQNGTKILINQEKWDSL